MARPHVRGLRSSLAVTSLQSAVSGLDTHPGLANLQETSIPSNHSTTQESDLADSDSVASNLNFAHIPSHSVNAPGIQTKLAINRQGDEYEQEADQIADHVMRMQAIPNVESNGRPSQTTTQRKCACGGTCDRCKADDGEYKQLKIQRKSTSTSVDAPSMAPPIVNEVLGSPGQPLDAFTRAFMEPRFGHDFSRVRIHADSKAAASANEIAARSFAAGNHLVFAAGEYSPASLAGRRLLSHELAHVVQQSRLENPAANAGDCERDAEDAAASVSSGNAPVVQSGAVFGKVQRKPATEPIGGRKAQKNSPLVRVERYWHSPSARAFFADGSNEEVTFVESSKLDPATEPEGAFEKVVSLTVDWSSLIRPHVEFTSHSSGLKVKVVTRLSPADRISNLPGRVRGELSEGLLSDTENASNPETMEFIADMGDRLKETSSTMNAETTGRDPATVSRMQVVDQWVGEQQKDLVKLSGTSRARFTQLLSDIRQVGVTGPVEAEDLDAQDIELVAAGAAGGQSDFKTFGEFKRGMALGSRFGNKPLPEEAANNPEFFVRNEYRKAWKAEATALRRMDRIAKSAQAAPFVGIGASAALGAGGALLEVAGVGIEGWATARGISSKLLGKYVGTSLLATSAVEHFMSSRDEAKAAGMNPDSPSGIANTVSISLLRALGIGDVVENVENKSLLTQRDLKRSLFERFVGGGLGALNMAGNVGTFVPEVSGVVPGAAPRAEYTVGETTVRPDPAVSTDLPTGAPQPDIAGTGGRVSPSAELHVPGPHPFFKSAASNSNTLPLSPEAQLAEVPLAATGTGGSASVVRRVGPGTVPTETGAGGTQMAGGGIKPETVEQYQLRGGKIKYPDPGLSGLKKPPKPSRPPVTAAPKGLSVEQQIEEQFGPANDSPEVDALKSSKSSGGTQAVSTEVGNFAHNSLPGYLDRMRAELAGEQSPAARADLQRQIAELEAMTQWPAGVEPNHLAFPMSDGRPGIPDGLDLDNGIVYELKPNTESAWARRGQYQADEYAAVLNKMKYAGRKNWVGKTITYDAESMTAQMRTWGVIPKVEPE
jgi:hypothetical protein